MIDRHAEVCMIQTVEEIFSRPFEIGSHVFIRIPIAVTATCCYMICVTAITNGESQQDCLFGKSLLSPTRHKANIC